MMSELTRTQLKEMSQVWREMARNLTVYQVAHWHELSTVQHFDLNAYQTSLLTRAQDLDEHPYLPLNEPVAALLNVALPLLEKAVYSLHNTQEHLITLNMGALGVAIAAGLSRGNVGSTQLALTELAQLMQETTVTRST